MKRTLSGSFNLSVETFLSIYILNAIEKSFQWSLLPGAHPGPKYHVISNENLH